LAHSLLSPSVKIQVWYSGSWLHKTKVLFRGTEV